MGRRLVILLALALLAGAVLSHSLDLQCYAADHGCCQEHATTDNCDLEGALAGTDTPAAPPPSMTLLSAALAPPAPSIPSERVPDRAPPGHPDTASPAGLRAPPR